MAINPQRLALVLSILDKANSPSTSTEAPAAAAPAPSSFWQNYSANTPSQPQSSGGFDWKGALGNVLNAVSVPLHAVTSTAVEGGRLVGQDLLGKDYGANNPSLSNWWQGIVNPQKEVNFGDVVSGAPSKGLNVGLFAGQNAPGGSVFASHPNGFVRGALGFAGDVALDPLTYVEPAGLAKETLARETAQSTARQALTKAAEVTGQDLAPGAIDEAIQHGGDAAETLGRLREAANVHPDVANIVNQGMDVTARARRYGISALNPDEITQFLTKEGTLNEPLAQRGLEYFGHHIPGTDVGLPAKLGELKSAAVAKLGDTFGGSLPDKAFTEQTTRELTAAARSGSPKAAYEAVLTQAARDTAKNTARGLIGQWSTKLADLTKNFSDEDMKNLTPALEGDQGAISALDGQHAGVADLLHDIHTRATEAGLNVNELADYAPRELSPEGRQLLESYGASRGGKLGANSSFEMARSLKPEADGLYHFGGESFKATTEADVRANVNRIAQAQLGKIDPAAAKGMKGFFNDDAQSALTHYFGRAARRISESDAASRLYAMGLGNAKITEVADRAAQGAAEGMRATADEADLRAHDLLQRATQHEGAQDELGRHILGQRLGQTELSAAGTPVTSPLTDEESVRLAAAAHADAQAAVAHASARLDNLEQSAAQRGADRSAAAESLQHDVNGLRTRLAGAEMAGEVNRGEVTRIQSQITDLENEGRTWTARRDAILSDAVAGKRTDVVMPTKWGYDTLHDEAVPMGGWKPVEPKVAFRNAPIAHVAQQAIHGDIADFRELAGTVLSSGSDAEKFDNLTRIFTELKIKPPGWTGGDLTMQNAPELQSAIEKYVGQNLIGDPIETQKVLTRIRDGLLGERNRIAEELKSAATVAERAVRSDKTGLITAPLSHGTPMRWTGDVPTAPTDASHALENLDGPGLYTSTDQSGRIQVGDAKHQLSEVKELKGYSTSERMGFGANSRQQLEPTVYAYAQKDPAVKLLPLDRAAHPEDIGPTLTNAVNQFYGGDHWMFSDAPLQTGNHALDEIAQRDPIGAFLIHDAVQHAGVQGPQADALIGDLVNGYQFENGFGGAYAALRQHAIDSMGKVSSESLSQIGSLQSTTRVMDDTAAAQFVKDYTDHLYDDHGVKGITREGGKHYGLADATQHDHMIWFRPQNDLEMVGKSDFSAAFAEKQLREIAHAKAKVTDLLKQTQTEGDTSAIESELAAKEAALAKATQPARETVATQRARGAVQSAVQQSDATEQYLHDTVDEIKARRTAHIEEGRRITAMLQSAAPLPAEARSSMESYLADLHQSVLYGRVHEKALELADTQLQRYAALEQSAAEASAQAHDLHQSALELRDAAIPLDDKTVKVVSDAFNSGVQDELRPGVGTPQQIAEWLHGAQPIARSDGTKKFLTRLDKVVGWIKDWQIATPGFHVRNLMGGEFLNAQAGVSMESRYDFIRAWSKMLRGKDLSPEDLNLFNQVRSAVGKGQVEAESGMGLESLGTKGNANPLSRNNYWIHGSQTAGRNVDFYNRGVLAWHTLSNGGTLDDAVAAVNKFHFDYSDLSKFEQNIRHVVPFYTFTRKNLPLQVEQIFRNPKIYSRLAAAKYEIEAQSSPDKTVPSYFQDLMGIRLPWEHSGGHMYADPMLPPTSLNQFGDIAHAENNLAGMVTPLIKTPIEMHFNQQFFEGIPLSNKKAVPVPLPAILTKGLAPVLEATGLARNVNGNLYMTEKNAYVLGQAMPLISRYSRLMPADAKGRGTQLAQVLTWLGFRVQDDSQAVQDSYNKGIAYRQKNATSTESAFIKSAQGQG